MLTSHNAQFLNIWVKNWIPYVTNAWSVKNSVKHENVTIKKENCTEGGFTLTKTLNTGTLPFSFIDHFIHCCSIPSISDLTPSKKIKYDMTKRYNQTWYCMENLEPSFQKCYLKLNTKIKHGTNPAMGAGLQHHQAAGAAWSIAEEPERGSWPCSPYILISNIWEEEG